jgi:hypothetical protein
MSKPEAKANDINNECKWRLERVQNYTNSFYIKNLNRKESLYAGSYFFKIGQHKRNFYLWYGTNRQSQMNLNGSLIVNLKQKKKRKKRIFI